MLYEVITFDSNTRATGKLDMTRNAAATREKILDAARRQVLTRGFSATTVDDIQEAAGISRGTFFYRNNFV